MVGGERLFHPVSLMCQFLIHVIRPQKRLDPCVDGIAS